MLSQAVIFWAPCLYATLPLLDPIVNRLGYLFMPPVFGRDDCTNKSVTALMGIIGAWAKYKHHEIFRNGQFARKFVVRWPQIVCIHAAPRTRHFLAHLSWLLNLFSSSKMLSCSFAGCKSRGHPFHALSTKSVTFWVGRTDDATTLMWIGVLGIQ
jgi:hypothetical protein